MVKGNKFLQKLIFSFITLVAFLCCNYASIKAFPAYPDTLEGASIYNYKVAGDIFLNLHVLKTKSDNPVPAVVFFFGGGWKGGTIKQFEPHIRYLQNQGITAIAVDYRVSSRHNTQPVHAVQDAMDAIIYIKQNADELGVDHDRIIAAGGSAGGHLAAATATLKHFYPQESKFSPVPYALILFNPVISTMPEGYGYERLQDMAWSLSPSHHVIADLPPTLIFHGTNDKTVPLANILEFEEKMKSKENRIEVKIFEGKGHGFFNYGRKQNKDYQETIIYMKTFLQSLNLL